MELEITSYYCLCEELLSALNIEENSQIKTSNAEVMTVLLTAAAFFLAVISGKAQIFSNNMDILLI